MSSPTPPTELMPNLEPQAISSGHEGGLRDQVNAYFSRLKNGEMGALTEIVEIVRTTGALAATRAAASAEAERAIAALQILPTGPYREAMHALAAQLLDRRN